jgi:hypothetical protein
MNGRLAFAAEERGSIVLLVLLFMVLATALGTGLTTLAVTERLAADNYRAGVEASYAADAAGEFVTRELGARPEWTSALCCGNRSAFADGTRAIVLPSGDLVDLDRETTKLQSQTDAESGSLVAREQWQLFAWGPLERLAGIVPERRLPYAIVWIADDRGETDGNAFSDANGLVVLRAQARGARGTSRTVERVLKRGAGPAAEVLSSREIR